MTERIPLTSLQDILDVASDADFEQILQELPGDLRAMRKHAKEEGHDRFGWPLMWRRGGGPSTITTHCPDGSLLPRPLASPHLRAADSEGLTPAQAAHVAAAFPECRRKMAEYLQQGAGVVIRRQTECTGDVPPIAIAVVSEPDFWIACCHSFAEAVDLAVSLGLKVVEIAAPSCAGGNNA